MERSKKGRVSSTRPFLLSLMHLTQGPTITALVELLTCEVFGPMVRPS
jgi:hypothetical protein